MTSPPRPTKPEETPVFTIKRHFRIGILASRHPIRLISWLLALLFLFPELRWVVEAVFSMNTIMAGFATIIITFMLFFGIALLVYYIEYKFYPIVIYKDRIEFLEHFILRSHHRIPCRNITDIRVKASAVQKYYGLKSIWINLRATGSSLHCKDHWIELPDLKSASKAGLELRKIIQSLENGQLMDTQNSA